VLSMISRILHSKVSKAKERRRDLDPFYDFLDAVDMMRDSAKEEIKRTLLKEISSNAKNIAKLMLREIKKKDGKLKKQLMVLINAPVVKIAKKYFPGALQASEKLADEIISKVIKKNAYGEIPRWKAIQRLVERNSQDALVAALSIAADQYEINSTAMLAEMIAHGVHVEIAQERTEQQISTAARETGTFFNAIVGASQSSIFRVADTAMQEAFAFHDIQNNLRWVTFFTRSCPDCIERHGRVQSHEQWQAEGLPRSGATVCRHHCHCVLVPDEYSVDIAAPVPRERARLE